MTRIIAKVTAEHQTFTITVSRLNLLYTSGLPQDQDRKHVTEQVTRIPVGSDRAIAADSQTVFFRVEIFARRNNSSAEIWFPEYQHVKDGSLWRVLALSLVMSGARHHQENQDFT